MSLVDDLLTSIVERFRDLGLPPDEVEEAALDAMERVQKERGGSKAYVPSESNRIRRLRDRAIIADWNAHKSRAQIAAAYAVSLSTVHNVIREHLRRQTERESDRFKDWYL